MSECRRCLGQGQHLGIRLNKGARLEVCHFCARCVRVWYEFARDEALVLAAAGLQRIPENNEPCDLCDREEYFGPRPCVACGRAQPIPVPA